MTDRAFVLGHGLLVPGRMTWVPPSREVHFYADEGEILDMGFEPAILAAGDVPSRQVYQGGEPIPNYLLSPHDEDDIRDKASAVSSRLRAALYFVGNKPLEDDALLLCTGPGCNQAGHSAACRGLFNRVRARELHILACRASRADAPYTAALGVTRSGEIGPEEFGTDLTAKGADILRMARQHDPFDAMERFSALPQATRVSLLADPVLAAWVSLMTRPVTVTSPDADVEHAVGLVQAACAADERWYRPLLLALPDRMREVLVGKVGVGPELLVDLVTPALSRLRPTFDSCWSSPAHRVVFVEWVSGRSDAHRGLALVRVYRAVRGMLDRMRTGGQGNTAASWLAKDVLVDLDGLLDEGGYRRAGLDQQFHEATADMIEYVSTGPDGKPADAWRTWTYEMRELFAEFVVRLLRRLEAAAVAGLEPLYVTYLEENSPAST